MTMSSCLILLTKRDQRSCLLPLGLHTVIHSHQRPLIKAIAKNVKIRFLIFNVESPNAKILDQTLGERNLANTLKGSFSKVLCLGQ
jgi:hypothetical protein